MNVPNSSGASLVSQTKLAFDILQRLYDECAMLVRELELALNREQERLVVVRPAGYGISSRRSVGLDPTNVQLWPLRKFSILFVPEAATKLKDGVTHTSPDVRGLYLRFVLDDYASIVFGGHPLQQPTIIYAVFREVTPKGKLIKLEELLAHIEYRDAAVFRQLPQVQFEDVKVRIVGTCEKVNLFDLTDAVAVSDGLVKPALALYRA
jgi:hypothetical protein